MIIRQEEKSPVSDAYDRTHLTTAFKGIEEQATGFVLDSELLKTYCEETIKLLSDFISTIEKIEKKLEKENNKNTFREKLYGNVPYNDD